MALSVTRTIVKFCGVVMLRNTGGVFSPQTPVSLPVKIRYFHRIHGRQHQRVFPVLSSDSSVAEGVSQSCKIQDGCASATMLSRGYISAMDIMVNFAILCDTQIQRVKSA